MIHIRTDRKNYRPKRITSHKRRHILQTTLPNFAAFLNWTDGYLDRGPGLWRIIAAELFEAYFEDFFKDFFQHNMLYSTSHIIFKGKIWLVRKNFHFHPGIGPGFWAGSQNLEKPGQGTRVRGRALTRSLWVENYEFWVPGRVVFLAQFFFRKTPFSRTFCLFKPVLKFGIDGEPPPH